MHEHELSRHASLAGCQHTVKIRFSPAMTAFISKEAKKLEKQRKNQLRRNLRIERSNQIQNDKQVSHRIKRQRWDRKLVSVEGSKQERARVLKLINGARFQVHEKLASKVTIESVQHRDSVIARNLEQEHRADQNLSRLKRESESADVWNAKYGEVRDRLSLKEIESERKKAKILENLEHSNRLFLQRKACRVRYHQLKGADVNLRLVDALEKRNKIESEKEMKLVEIKSLINKEDDDGLAEIFTKGAILQRRKAVAELERLNAPSAVSLLGDIPGPAEYDPVLPATAPAISFAKSAHLHASSPDGPAPGAYNPRVLVDGTKPWMEIPVASFGTSSKTSFIEQHAKHTRSTPGPAAYDIPALLPPNTAPKIVADLELPRKRDEQTPGPATYTVDTFTKTEKFMKAINTADPMFKNLFDYYNDLNV